MPYGRKGGMRRKPQNVRTGPLRKIVKEQLQNPDHPLLFNYEELECGHVQRAPEDFKGIIPSARRRCRQCGLIRDENKMPTKPKQFEPQSENREHRE